MTDRRRFAAALLATATFGIARAQPAYPNRPIRFIVPFPAGGGGDAVARLVAQSLSQRLRNPVVVENRAGAGGVMGADYVLKSPADGYTLLNLSSTYAIQAALLPQLPFDPVADLQPVLMVSRDPMVMLVPASSPLRTVKDLADAARRAPGKLTYGSSGIGATSHLAMEELAFRLGLKLVHVPYKGSAQAFNDLLGDHVDVAPTSTTHAASFVRAGRVRALGVASLQRSPALPDVPTMQEQGITGYEVADWKAVGGPKGMPGAIVAQLNTELNAILQSRALADQFEQEGTTAVGGRPDQMMDTIRDDIARWRQVAQRANIRL